MTARRYRTVAEALGLAPQGHHRRVLRVLEALVGCARDVLERDPGPSSFESREQLGAALWVLGLWDCEPDEDGGFAWLRRNHLDVGLDLPRASLPEAEPVAALPVLGERPPESPLPSDENEPQSEDEIVAEFLRRVPRRHRVAVGR